MKEKKQCLAFMLVLIMLVSIMPVQIQAASKSAVKKVTLNVKQYVLKKGEKFKLKASVSPSKAKSSVKLTWKSSNKKVAVVNGKGQVTAKAKKGKAVITVKAGARKASCKIIVGIAVKKITAGNMELSVDETASINATVVPKNASLKKLIYKSESPSIVKVDQKGNVKALKPGTAKVTITAADRSKVKKVVQITVSEAVGNTGKDEDTQVPPVNSATMPVPTNAENPSAVPTDSASVTTEEPSENVPTASIAVTTEEPKKTAVPSTENPSDNESKFSMSFAKEKVALAMGDSVLPEIHFTPESNVKDKDIVWSSTDDTVAAVVSSKGKIQALMPGTTTITAISQQDNSVKASMKVTVSDEGVITENVSSQEELLKKLHSLSSQEGESDVIVTLGTKENKIVIPKGDYQNVTLVVKAPNATVENSAAFKNVIIEEIAEDTWCEKKGNHIYIDSAEGHIVSESTDKSNVYLLDDTESITVDADKNLQELLIASAAKVLVKGDSVADRISCEYLGPNGRGKIETYIPLDIYSTTKFKLVVGPGGEQTAVKVSGEGDVPDISGLGTISITVDSTGKKKTVIAEYSSELKKLPVTTVAGRVKKDAGTKDDVVDATVYLVRYYADLTNENISVYLDGSSTKKVETDNAGKYSFESVALGNYVIVVEAEGYQLLTQNIYIDSSYGDDRAYEVDDIILMDTDGEVGRIEGVLSDASSGEGISKGLKVILRKGLNNITANEVDTVKSDAKGCFAFEDVMPGQYTIQVRDDSDQAPYLSVYENVSVLAGATITKNMTLTRALDTDEVRFVLTWGSEGSGASKDLDIYLYGPNPFENTEYSVSFSDKSLYNYGKLMNGSYVSRFAMLDVDDKAYDGPETITVKKVTKGQYKVFVQDYSNGGSGSQLRDSGAVIKVYKGSNLLDTVKMPDQDGGVWFAGCYDGETGKFTSAGEVYSGQPNTTVRAQVAKQLNLLEQFEVTDAAAFAEDQKMIDEVKKNYLKTTVSREKLSEYLESLQELVEKLKDGLVMKRITAAGGIDRTYGSFCTNHGLSYLSGKEETLKDFNVEMKSEDASFSCKKAESGCYYDYRLTLNNEALGVSTAYYFDYHYNRPIQQTEYWVESIKDPDNTGWREECYESYGYTGGNNAEIGRNLKVTLMDGIEVESMEYAADAEDGSWEYGDSYCLVLHLKKTATDETKDFKVSYKPLGAELLRITDTTNRIISQYSSSYYYWYQDDAISYRVTGENKEMGNKWQAEVSEGATYELKYPSDDDDYASNLVAIMTVSKTNGAKQVYNIYYEQDTSDAAIIGIYDKDNMYTEYSEGYTTTYRGKTTINISLEGMNSELGTDLKVYTKPGASAKVEYATSSVSWDRSSDAKVTVTAKSGQERIYYINYSKSSEICNIRGISSKSNTFKKVYKSYNSIYIIGSDAELGSDDSLKIQTNAGYTASYSVSSGSITVKEDATGQEKAYSVYYTQDTTGFSMKDVRSEKGMIHSVYISGYLSSDSQTGEKYYHVALVGEEKSCPDDLNAIVPEGATAKVTYAGEDWGYSSDYVAKIEVTDGIYTQMYLLSYKQDESGAVVNGITDTENTYVNTEISTSTSTMYMNTSEEDEEAPTREEVYLIYVKGDKAELGSTYELELPEGSQVSGTIHKGEAGWRYRYESINHSYYDENDHYVRETYYYTDRVVVKAKNGAERVYVIAYKQDESGAVVNGITDTENTYLNTKISTSTSTMDMDASEEDEEAPTWEEVYLIYVKGDKAELGSTYELELPEGSKVSGTLHKGEAGWRYKSEYTDNGYYDSSKYYYTDRVVVKAKNGAERVYVIAYAQDKSGAVVNGITDTENTYLNTKISTSTSMMYMNASEEDEEAPTCEEVYLIYVKGDKAELGSTYELELPEGSQVLSTLHKGEAGWRYRYESTSHSYYDENDNYVWDTYYYTDRVVVKAKNGAERVYVIAYAQDESGAVVNGITDTENTYVNTKISTSTSMMDMDASEEDAEAPTREEVYLIYVKGDKAELGSTYELELPEESKVSSTLHKGEAGWRYEEEYTRSGYYDENDNYVSDVYYYTDRVVVKAKNGVERVYVIAYAQDKSGAVVNGITDTENTYVNTEISTSTSTMYMDASEEDEEAPTREEVYLIYVKGDKAELGSTYELELPEGSQVSSTLHKGETGWRYEDESRDHSYRDKDYNYISDTYYYTDRVVVKAKNGAERVYVIAYAQDKSGAVVKGITDTENTYVNTEISTSTSTMYMNASEEDEEAPTYEEVYLIYVKGDKAELGSTYELELPEGSQVSSTLHKGEAGWRYQYESYNYSYYDKDYNYIWDTYYYTDRVVVKAKNGVERVYVIAYAQDESGAVVKGITDTENMYVNTKISTSTSTMYMNASEEDEEAPTREEVYLIYVKGDKAELGSTYELELPEGSKVSSTLHKGEAGWRYEEEYTRRSYYDENNNYVSDTYYYTDRVVVKAKNGAERIYVIAYAQDESGAVVNGITDTENTYLNTEISTSTSPMYMNASEEDEEAPTREEVYLIYVKGDNAELGSTYELELPEGSKVSGTLHKGDAGWRYRYESDDYSYYDENDNYVQGTYYYTDRVVVKAKNGAERVYVIAYASTEAV